MAASGLSEIVSPAAAERPGGRRIALLTPCYWPEVRRGAERMVHDLAVGLRDRGHRPRIITSHPGPPSRRTEDGVPIVRHWRPPDGRLRRRSFDDYLTHVPFSYLSLLRADAEVVEAFAVPDAIAAVRWGRCRGRPTILHHVGIPTRQSLVWRRGRAALTHSAASQASAVLVLSRHSAAALERSTGIHARVIYPGVDLAAFSPGDGRAAEPTVLCAAPVELPRKRVELLVTAFAAVRRSRPGARLLLMRPADPALARRMGAVEPAIEWIEPVERAEDLAPVYRRAWVSVLPSFGESFGLVLAEALACGTPVVGSRWDALPEIVDRPEIGRIFDVDEPAAVAAAVLEALDLAKDPGTAAACRGRAEDFSLERHLDAHERLFQELIG